jgi:hypothetical protein
MKISARRAKILDISNTGMRRVQYKTEKTLAVELAKLCRDHDYTKRFENALRSTLRGKSKGAKKSGRALALKLALLSEVPSSCTCESAGRAA